MNKLISYVSKNLLSVVGVAILTGTTLTTSALGVMKVANNFEKIHLDVPEVKEMEPPTLPETSPTPGTSANGSTDDTGGLSQPANASNIKKAVGTSPLIPKPTIPTTQSVNSNTGCIVTLFGSQYDVTSLRSSHSGGNIFNCGTDMTSVYQGKHGSNLSRMQQYQVISGGTTNSGNTSGGTNNTTQTIESEEDGDDHKEEIEIHEEEKKEEEKEIEETEGELETFLRHFLQIRVS